MNGSSEGDMHVVGAASGKNRTHHICGTASEAGSTSVVIQECGGLPKGPPSHEV